MIKIWGIILIVQFVPENIHTHSVDGHWKLEIGNWKFQMGGGLKAQIFNGKYMAKLEFLVGWVGLKPESCGGRGYG